MPSASPRLTLAWQIMSAPHDLHTVTRFLDHLAERDAKAAAFARQLLDAGAVVRSIWGPVQMDVWDLQLLRGGMIVRFGIERGFSDGVLVGRADPEVQPTLHPISLVVFAWARANGIPLPVDDPNRIEVDLSTQGIAAVEWIGAGHDDAVEQVRAAWLEYQRKRDRLQGRMRGRPADAELSALHAAGVAALEAAAHAPTA